MPTKKQLIKSLKKDGYKYKDLKKMKKWELEELKEDNYTSFGSSYMAPSVIPPGNLQIQTNIPFSDIYPYAYDNLSGYPWSKGCYLNAPTLPVAPKNSFGKSFNYTINQYATNQATPTLNQMHNISGDSAYSYPIGGVSSNGHNFRYYKPKNNNNGMGF